MHATVGQVLTCSISQGETIYLGDQSQLHPCLSNARHGHPHLPNRLVGVIVAGERLPLCEEGDCVTWPKQHLV